ncbi:MAG: hypothetical protein ACI92G_001533 [Candidatus Pelagisphaera sp.]|jgi:hypothetical protein
MTTTTTKLPLDKASIPTEELSVPALMRELNLQKRPNWILSKLMNSLEGKRQAKGMGWSRAWNKKDLNVFRTHKMDSANDAKCVEDVADIIHDLLESASDSYRSFASSLLLDPKLMIFVFHHNRDSKGNQYEGLTISLGRKVAEDPSKRDRIDLIMEDRRVDGRVDGMLDQVRLYVCPWSEYQNEKGHSLTESSHSEGTISDSTQDLYESSVRSYHKWKSEEERQWSHWSANFIDYFGARSFIPVGTSFS